MNSSYHLNPAAYTLQQLKDQLLSRTLIPSRKPLTVNINNQFDLLHKAGINTLEDLLTSLKTRKKIEEFSKKSGIDFDYLNLLRREVNSYLPTPILLKEFSGFSAEDLQRLTGIGIKNSRQLFERAGSSTDRLKLAEISGIEINTLNELAGLSDLARIYGVGPAFARILYDSGIHSVCDFRAYTPQQVIDLYEEKANRKADFTLSDLKFSLELIQALDPGPDS